MNKNAIYPYSNNSANIHLKLGMIGFLEDGLFSYLKHVRTFGQVAFSKKKMKSIYCCFLLILFYSCNNTTNYNIYIHKNGLQINVPNTYTSIQKTDFGFLIGKLEDKDIRNPRVIRIEHLSDDSMLKKHTWKSLDMNVFFRTEIYEGGSGGTLFIFQAWKKSNSKTIFLEESYQDEYQKSPVFKIGKEIILASKIL